MHTLKLSANQHEVTISNSGEVLTLDKMQPIDIILLAIAKDVHKEISSKSQLMNLSLDDFSIEITLRKNPAQAKSKIIETQLHLPQSLSIEIKNKLQKIADADHLKRMLGNEILFAPTRLL